MEAVQAFLLDMVKEAVHSFDLSRPWATECMKPEVRRNDLYPGREKRSTHRTDNDLRFDHLLVDAMLAYAWKGAGENK